MYYWRQIGYEGVWLQITVLLLHGYSDINLKNSVLQLNY